MSQAKTSPVKPKTYVGFASTQHDPAIAIINEQGQVVFAESLERPSKNKRAWNIVPDQIGMIEPCLEKYVTTPQVKIGASWSQPALAWSPLIFALTYLISKTPLAHKDHVRMMENSFLRLTMYKAPSSLRHMFLNFEHRLRQKQCSWSKQGVNHHLAHAFTGVCTSKYEQATIVVMDGMGEGCSYAIYELKQNQIYLKSSKPVLNMASLGLFYASICEACGFDPIKGEEWKVMGLAAYGKHDATLYSLLKSMLKVKHLSLKKNRYYRRSLSKIFEIAGTYSTPMDARDLAYTTQQVYEALLFEYLENVYQAYPNPNLILVGGCALNSSANGKIINNTSFSSLHVPMCPGDDGNALGVAVKLWHDDHPQAPIPRVHTPYLGSCIEPTTIRKLIKNSSLKSETFSSFDTLCQRVSLKLSKGNIIAWVQGRAEFGPRALGNRSILADPRNTKIKEFINANIKFRESFRPFAPSILDEFKSAYFEDAQYAPYMERTLKFKKFNTPGVVHHNQTGRLQTVTKELNPRFYQLIKSFYDITSVPILLNTSFNVMSRPIVHDIEDAIGVFMVSGIDILVIENTLFYKANL